MRKNDVISGNRRSSGKNRWRKKMMWVLGIRWSSVLATAGETQASGRGVWTADAHCRWVIACIYVCCPHWKREWSKGRRPLNKGVGRWLAIFGIAGEREKLSLPSSYHLFSRWEKGKKSKYWKQTVPRSHPPKKISCVVGVVVGCYCWKTEDLLFGNLPRVPQIFEILVSRGSNACPHVCERMCL